MSRCKYSFLGEHGFIKSLNIVTYSKVYAHDYKCYNKNVRNRSFKNVHM